MALTNWAGNLIYRASAMRFGADDLARVLPRLSDALDLARRLDPRGRFASDML